MIECEWLPELVLCNDLSKFSEYQDIIYLIFKKDLIEKTPYFNGAQVKIRYEPYEFGKEEAFWHVTCKDYNKAGERFPDIRRCERIRWIKSFIENFDCNKNTCDYCEGIKIWSEPYKSKIRIHILLKEERYIVVLEKRPHYFILITAFYYDEDHTLNNALKRYEKFRLK